MSNVISLEVQNQIVEAVKSAHRKMLETANSTVVQTYWLIGKILSEKVKGEEWGGKTVEILSKNLRKELNGMTGLSKTNLDYMRAFYERCKDPSDLFSTYSHIPWGHNIVLLKIKNESERLWYAKASIENGWSRNVLVHQIEGNLMLRSGKAVSNFRRTMAPVESELVQAMTKDPYIFDFLSLREDFKEADLENELVSKIQEVLLEMGKGFAFVGRQYHLNVGGQDYYLDLLFYNIILRRYVVVELKIDEFKPEYAGKITFYLTAVDRILKRESDNPSVGLILCKTKNGVVAEYSLGESSKPIGVSTYSISEKSRKFPELEILKNELNGIIQKRSKNK